MRSTSLSPTGIPEQIHFAFFPPLAFLTKFLMAFDRRGFLALFLFNFCSSLCLLNKGMIC